MTSRRRIVPFYIASTKSLFEVEYVAISFGLIGTLSICVRKDPKLVVFGKYPKLDIWANQLYTINKNLLLNDLAYYKQYP